MTGKYNNYTALRLNDEARELLESVVRGLWKRPPAPESGKATLSSVGSTALVEGLRVLIERHGLTEADMAQQTGNSEGGGDA